MFRKGWYAIPYAGLIYSWLLLLPDACWAQTEIYPSLNTFVTSPKDTATILQRIRAGEKLAPGAPDSAVALFRRTLAESEAIYFTAGMKRSLQQLLPLLGGPEQNRLLLDMERYCTRSQRLEPVLAVVYNALAKNRQLQEQYEQAGEYYMKAINLTAKYDPAYLATVYNNYGSLLFTLPDDSAANSRRALFYLDKAETLARRYKDQRIITCVLSNKAKMYRNNGRYEESMDFLLRGLELARENHFAQWESVLLNNIGDLYFCMGRFREAIPFLEQSMQIRDPGIDPYYRNMAVFTLGEVYFAMKDNDKAEQYFSLSLKTAEQFGIARDLIEANRKLALIYASRGDYERAFLHQLAYAHINDSLRNKSVVENVQQLEVRYRTSEKDRELLRNKLHMERQEQQLRRKNTFMLLSVALVLLSALIFLFIYNRIRQKQKILLRDEQIREMAALIKGEEQERIRLAQELHDGIGGMLAAVNMNMQVARRSGFSSRQELQEVMQMIEDTTDEVRKTAHNLMPSALLRKNLKEALQHYCDHINRNGTLCIDLNTHGDMAMVDAMYKTVIFRIVQELVQNIIRHAEADHAIVSLERSTERISLLVEDNGKGFNKEQTVYGFGLENLGFRVKTLGGTLDIQSEPGTGTSITVVFRIETAA